MATQPPQNEKRSVVGIEALALALVALGGFWLWLHTHMTQLGPGTQATGVASRLAGEGEPTFESAPQFASEPEPIWENLDSLKFASGSSKLPTGASAQLDEIADMLKDDLDLHLTIAGFTDDVGSAREKRQISRSRADRVKNALVARGIAPDRITAQGFGAEDPIADNATAEGRAKNRRVSMRVTLY